MYLVKELDNGLKVLLLKTDSKNICFSVASKVGSRYESKNINGISHFLEHLMFKGTKKRPSQADISRSLDKIGAQFNAYTAKDRTVYYAIVNKDDIEIVNDVLFDMLEHSVFDKEAIEHERGVIIEEINMYEDNPLMSIEDLLEQLSFGDNPLGRDIAGPKENIKNITRTDILEYYKAYYHPENMYLVVNGGIDIDRTFDLLNKTWGQVKKVKYQGIEFEKIRICQRKAKIKIKQKDTEQIQMALGFPAFSYSDTKRYALDLLSVIFGGNMSSRLFLKIREDLGLCYLIKTHNSAYEDNGLFFIHAGLDKSKILDAIKAILKEIRLLLDKGITEKELKDAKSYMKGHLSIGTESVNNQNQWYLHKLLFLNKIESPEDYLDKIDKVDKMEVNNIIEKIFKVNKINLALLGDLKYDEKEIEKLLILK